MDDDIAKEFLISINFCDFTYDIHPLQSSGWHPGKDQFHLFLAGCLTLYGAGHQAGDDVVFNEEVEDKPIMSSVTLPETIPL